MKHIFLSETIIWNIESDCTYHVHSNVQPENEMIVTFSGIAVKDYVACNLSSGTFLHKNGQPVICPQQDFFHITKDLVPRSKEIMRLPPVLLYIKKTKKILQVTKLHYKLDSNIISISANGNLISSWLEFFNEEIRVKCQKLTPDILAITSSLPIFREDKMPSLKFLGNIYQQFIVFNTKEKLDYQVSVTPNLCQIRAHFINALLNIYGITSLKVYKFWNPNDWQSIPSNKQMSYHCAALLNNKWVWDPWVGNHKTLLTLNQWLNVKSEPKPTHYLIASQGVISTLSTNFNDACNFMSFSYNDNVSAMQALIADALPNLIIPLKLKTASPTIFFSKPNRYLNKSKNSHDSNELQNNTINNPCVYLTLLAQSAFNKFKLFFSSDQNINGHATPINKNNSLHLKKTV